MISSDPSSAPVEEPRRSLNLVDRLDGEPGRVTAQLARGIVWADVVAEIERDRLSRECDAA